jgi:hypothetical protein
VHGIGRAGAGRRRFGGESSTSLARTVRPSGVDYTDIQITMTGLIRNGD